MCAVSCCREVGSCFESGNAPNSPLIRPPLAWDEASVAPEIVRTCRVASYQGAPSAGSSPLTISPFQTAGRCVSILLSVIGCSVRLKGGVLTYRVEVSSVPDKSWFAGLYPEREVDARSGLGLGVRYR